MASDESSPWMNSSHHFPPDFQNYLKEEKYLCKKGDFHSWIFQAEGQLHAIDSTIEMKIREVFEAYNQTAYKNILLQFWKAVKMREDLHLLTTRQQPFLIFGNNCEELYGYRQACRNYEYFVDNQAEEEGRLGILGRVFKYKSFEFTTNVIHCTIQEYPQLDEARRYCIRQILAFPVFELSTKQHVGVIEFMATASDLLSEWVYYLAGQFRHTLTGSGLGIPHRHATCPQGLLSLDTDYVKKLKSALKEICKNPAICMAQAWEPCNDYQFQFNRDITGINNLGLLLSIFNKDFEHRCAYLDNLLLLNHIRERQGVAGMSFSSRKMSLCTEISQLSIIDYPLKPYIIEFGCNGIFAICLQSNTSGNVLVLELFFNYYRDVYAQLYQILEEMKKHLPSFRDSFGQELGEKLPILHIPEERNQIQHPPSDTAIFGNNDVGQSDIHNLYPPKEGEIKELARQHRKSGIPISLEDIEQQFGKKLDDAAKSIGVSRSTFKRACREFEISWWQPSRRKMDNPPTFCPVSVERVTQDEVLSFIMPSSLEQPHKPHMAPDTFRMQHFRPLDTIHNVNVEVSDFVREVTQDQVSSLTTPSSSKQLCEPLMAVDTFRMQHSTPLEIVNNVNIKVVYDDNSTIRFQLSLSSGVEKLQQEVVRRLNWVNFGTYNIQYIDEENHWVLIACDDDLHQYMSSSVSSGKATIILYLKPFNIFA